MPVPCHSCERNMSEVAVVCPHCGARQPDRDPRRPRRSRCRDAPAGYREPGAAEAAVARPRLKVSADEAAALFATVGASDAEGPRGPVSLLTTRDWTRPWVRTVERILTVLAAPVVLLGMVSLLFRLRFFYRAIDEGREEVLGLVVGILGGLLLYTVGRAVGFSGGVALGFAGISLGALLARALVRRTLG